MIHHSKERHPSLACKVLAAGFMGAFIGSQPAFAQETNAPTELKPVVVTGSYIPVAEGASVASPVEMVTTTKIAEAGQSDVLNSLRKLSASFTGSGNVGATLNNNSANPGEGNVALRNLPTLVLLDGRRVANSGLSHGTAVDIYTIPLGMIDRIEVLKDGASSLYGSDAIGGVVNIITKKNYNGAEVYSRGGFADEKGNQTEQRFYVVGGSSTENTRVVVGAEYYHMDPILSKDRFGSSASIFDLAQQTGGAGVGIAPPSYFSGSFPGRVDNYILIGSPFAVGSPGYQSWWATNTAPPIIPGGPFASLAAYNTAASNYLGYRPYIAIDNTPIGNALITNGLAGYRTLLNTTTLGSMSQAEQERRSAFGNIEHNIFEDRLVVFGGFLFADNRYTTQLAPAPIAALGPAGLNQITIPADNPYNPFGVALGVGGAGSPRIRSRTIEGGTRTSINESEFYNFVGGLRGDINEHLSYEAAYNYSLNQQVLINENSFNGLALNQALTPNLAVDPTGHTSMLLGPDGNGLPTYNLFALPGFNSPATIEALRTSVYERGTSQLWGMDGRINGVAFELPAGKLNYALGGGFVEESLGISSDGLLQTGNAIGYNPNPTFSGGMRRRTYAFAEASIPFFSPDKHIPGFYDLEVIASGRFEHLEPGGDSEVPKVGVKWQPIDDQVTLRGTFSEGFVAPPLFDLFGPITPNNPTVTIVNPVLGTGSGQVTTSEGPNPNMPPATSVNWDLGLTLKPKFIPGPGKLTLTVDYYNVTEDGIPALPDYSQAFASLNALGSGSPYASGFRFADNSRLTTALPNQVAFASGNPAQDAGTLAVHYEGGAAQRTDGIDLGLQYVYPTKDWGTFTLAANANVLNSYEVRLTKNGQYYQYGGQYTSPSSVGGANGTLPDWIVTDSLTWEYKGWTANVSSRYIPNVVDLGDMFPTAGSPVNDYTYNGAIWTVDSWYAIDMQLSYKFGPDAGRALNGLRLAVGCNNITGNLAPFIASGSEDNTDKGAYDIIGRFVYFEVSKKF